LSTDFRTGNSGNFLAHAVIKTGEGCQQEGAFCQFLGRDVAPEVYTLLPDGYIMEKLRIPDPNRNRLCDIEDLLEYGVWNRPALAISNDIPFAEHLKVFGVNAPMWAVETDPCLVHGDPTVSNFLYREEECQYILADPRPPRAFIPQNRETDMGRILQSMLGWENAAYNLPRIEYFAPRFTKDPYLTRAAQFWCGAAAARIQYQELRRACPKKKILDWCAHVRDLYNV
jgi:hypothetical protein